MHLPLSRHRLAPSSLLSRTKRRLPVRAIAALLVALAAGTGAAGTVVAPAAWAAANLLVNGDFAAGSTSGWTCSAGDAVVTSPVYPGDSHALAGTPSGSDDAQCSQVVSVQPSSSYSLTGWVEGDYVFLGDSGTGTSDTSTWTPAAASWTQLSSSFTTGSATTSVTIYVHGWYGQPVFYADSLSLTGPAGSGGGGGGGTQPPAAPASLAVTGTTSSSVSLSWSAPSGTVTGYHVNENGSQVATVTGTSATITGLAASTAYTFTVSAYNSAGTSPQSGQVSATTSSSGGGGGGGGGSLPAHLLMGYWQDFTNGAKPLTLANVPSSYNLIAVAFGTATTTPGQVAFSLDPTLASTLGGYSQQQFISDIATLHSRGQKVILSVGGQNGTISVSDAASASSFASSVYSLIKQYGFDGVDIDLENGVNPDLHGLGAGAARRRRRTQPHHHACPADRRHPVHRQRLLPAGTGHQVHSHDDQHPVLQLGHDERLRRQRLRRGHRELHDRPGLHRAAGRAVAVAGRPRAAGLIVGGRQRLRQPVLGQQRAGLPGGPGKLRQLRPVGGLPGPPRAS